MGNLPGMAYRCLNDRNWTMLVVSEGCLALTGYTPADLIRSTNVSYRDLIHSDDQDRVYEVVQKALQSVEPFVIEYRIICANGEEKWVSERGVGGIHARPGNARLDRGIHRRSDRAKAG